MASASLLIAQGLSLAYGRKILFEDEGFVLGFGDRAGLVGANGTGKSSLLKILAGAQEGDAGRVQITRGARVGYLPQEIVALPSGTVVEAVLSSVPGRDELESRLVGVEKALHEAVDEAQQLALAESLAHLHEELDHFEERHGRHHAERILAGLGFSPADLEKATAALSGGWRMRAALAALLLQDPDLLLLDEPTNHLDVPSLAWFDGFLKGCRKALVLISHDRDFLNRHINRVLALEVEGLRTYPGNYDAYLEARAAEVELLTAKAERQEQRRAELQAFIDRFGAKASKARQAQSRQKQLDKMEVIETLKERERVHFRFPEAPRSGREIAELRGVTKRYGAQRVYEDLSVRVERGQRIGIIGANGAGKSTLLKLIAGDLAPDAGEVRLGQNVHLGYYAQHHAEALDRGASVLEAAAQVAPAKTQAELRSALGAFLFSGDDVDKKVGVLSGGERARVALARLLLVPVNFLLMDEPTNHLDLDSSELLIEALKGYQGTLLFVSHHGRFVNELATSLWDVHDGRVDVHQGNLKDYLERKRREALESGTGEGGEAGSIERSKIGERDRKRAEAEARQKKSVLTGPLKKEIAALEARIGVLEGDQKHLEGELARPDLYDDFAKAREVTERHQQQKQELEALYQRWEEAQGELARANL
jgi:ATP-binding cassette subfamily F protein 3